MKKIENKCNHCIPPICIGIGGATRSGKSTLAKSLYNHYKSPYPYISQDNFYLEDKKPIVIIDKNTSYQNWECIESLDMKLFHQKIKDLKELATKKCEECLKKSGNGQQFESDRNPHFIFVEGFLLFVDENIKKEFDKQIFLCIDKSTCFERRMGTIKVSEKYFNKVLWPTYVQYHQKCLFRNSKKPNFDGLVLNSLRTKEELVKMAIDFIDGKQVDGDENLLYQTLFSETQSLLSNKKMDSFKSWFTSSKFAKPLFYTTLFATSSAILYFFYRRKSEKKSNEKKNGNPKNIKPLVICGPSGVGKGTLIKKLREEYGDVFGFSVSHTTRDPRPGEKDGVDYNFVSADVMKKEIEEGKFIEYAVVHGNMYGTSIDAVKKVQESGKCCILDIDVQGATTVRTKTNLDVFTVFIQPPSFEELEKRLRGRQTESDEIIKMRLENAKREIEFGKQNIGKIFDAVLINDDLEQSYQELKKIISKNLNIKL